jgi:hypothetical protein
LLSGLPNVFLKTNVFIFSAFTTATAETSGTSAASTGTSAGT